MAESTTSTKPLCTATLALAGTDCTPRPPLTDEEFKSATSAYALMTVAYGPDIGWKGCFPVGPFKDPRRRHEFESFFVQKRNSLGEDIGAIEDLISWSQFMQEVAASKGGDSGQICCETDIRKAAAQKKLAGPANFPLACQQSRAAVLGSHYAHLKANEGRADPNDVPDCEPLQWDEKRHVGSFIWAGIGTLLVETIWTIGETIIRRPWRLAPVGTIPARTIPEAAIRPWPLPVRGLGYALRQTGYPLRLLSRWFATRLVIPIVGGGLLLMGIDWIYARVKDPKCGVGFIPHIYVFVLDHIVAPPVRLVRQIIGLFKEERPIPEGGKGS